LKEIMKRSRPRWKEASDYRPKGQNRRGWRTTGRDVLVFRLSRRDLNLGEGGGGTDAQENHQTPKKDPASRGGKLLDETFLLEVGNKTKKGGPCFIGGLCGKKPARRRNQKKNEFSVPKKGKRKGNTRRDSFWGGEGKGKSSPFRKRWIVLGYQKASFPARKREITKSARGSSCSRKKKSSTPNTGNAAQRGVAAEEVFLVRLAQCAPILEGE